MNTCQKMSIKCQKSWLFSLSKENHRKHKKHENRSIKIRSTWASNGNRVTYLAAFWSWRRHWWWRSWRVVYWWWWRVWVPHWSPWGHRLAGLQNTPPNTSLSSLSITLFLGKGLSTFFTSLILCVLHPTPAKVNYILLPASFLLALTPTIPGFHSSVLF